MTQTFESIYGTYAETLRKQAERYRSDLTQAKDTAVDRTCRSFLERMDTLHKEAESFRAKFDSAYSETILGLRNAISECKDMVDSAESEESRKLTMRTRELEQAMVEHCSRRISQLRVDLDKDDDVLGSDLLEQKSGTVSAAQVDDTVSAARVDGTAISDSGPVYSDEYDASNVLLDDQDSTRWLGPDGTKTWVTIDLQSVHEVHSVEVRNTSNGGFSDRWTTDYTLETFLDGTWETAASGVLEPGTGDLQQIQLGAPRPARYVRFRVDGFGSLGGGLSFMGVYGVPR